MLIDLDHYQLYLEGYNIKVQATSPGKVEFKFTSSTAAGEEPPLGKFVQDMSLMNAIRKSQDPAVIEAFEQVLTIMALTNGREIPDYGPNNPRMVG